MKPRTRRSQATWLALIQQQIESGLSAAAFCRQHNINDKYFSKCKRGLHSEADASLSGSRFIKVHTVQPTCAASVTAMVLHYRNMQLHIPAGYDLHALAQLMALLS